MNIVKCRLVPLWPLDFRNGSNNWAPKIRSQLDDRDTNCNPTVRKKFKFFV